MYQCKKCDIEYESNQCPECGLAPSESEDWVTDDELYNEWQERIDYRREGDTILLESTEHVKSLRAIYDYPDDGVKIDDVPALTKRIDEELSILEGTKWDFYKHLFDVKMAVDEAVTQ